MTSHMIDLIKLRQFYIITHCEVDLLFIIHYLTYLTFFVNFSNHLFQSIYAINLFIKSTMPQACDMLFFQTYIYKRVYFYLLSYVWFRWLIFL